MSSRKRRILVTGGSGNLGRSFVRAFSSLHDVHAVVRGRDNCRPIEICGAKCHVLPDCDGQAIETLVASLRPEIIIANAACVNLVDSDDAIDELVGTNIQLTIDYLQAASRLQYCHFISFDSYSSYDNLGKPLYGSAYGRTKFITRELCELYSLRSNICATNLILYDIFHEGDARPNKVFNRVINAIINNVPTPLSVCDQEVSFVHMSDLLHAIKLVMERHFSSSFESYSVRGPEVKNLRDYFVQLSTNKNFKNLLFGEYIDQRPVQKLIDRCSSMPPNYEPKIVFSDWLIDQIKGFGGHSKEDLRCL